MHLSVPDDAAWLDAVSAAQPLAQPQQAIALFSRKRDLVAVADAANAYRPCIEPINVSAWVVCVPPDLHLSVASRISPVVV